MYRLGFCGQKDVGNRNDEYARGKTHYEAKNLGNCGKDRRIGIFTDKRFKN